MGGVAALALWVLAPRGPAPAGRFEAAPLARVRTERSFAEGNSVYHEIRLESDGGRSHRGLLRIPASGEPPFTAVAMVGGIESGRRCVRYVPDSGTPILWAAIDYPYRPPREADLMTLVRELPRASDGVERMVAGLRLLLDHLEGRDDVDPDRILICGGSLGAFPAVIAGAVDPRFEGVIVLNGGAGLERIVTTNLRIDPPWMRRAAARMLRPWLGPFEPTHFVSRVAPRPFLQIHGTRDRMMPRESAMELFEAAEEPKELLWFDMPHVVQGDERLSGDVEAAVLDWMARHGFEPPL